MDIEIRAYGLKEVKEAAEITDKIVKVIEFKEAVTITTLHKDWE